MTGAAHDGGLLDHGYVVAAALNAALVVGVSVAFVLQILSEPLSPRPVVSVKKLFHRIGLVACALLLLEGADFDGVVFQKLPYEVSMFASVNVTCVLFCGLAALAYYVENANAGLILLTGKPWRLRRFLYLLSALFATVANTLYALMAGMDREFLRGVAYVWTATMFLGLAGFAFVGMHKLRSGMREAMTHKSSPGNLTVQTLQRSVSRLLVLQVTGGLIIATAATALLVRGLTLLRDTDAPLRHAQRDRFEVSAGLFLAVQWAAILLFFWWSMTPFYIIERHRGLAASSSAAYPAAQTTQSTTAGGGSKYGAVATSPRASINYMEEPE